MKRVWKAEVNGLFYAVDTEAIEIIRSAERQVSGADARVYLFGSRTDDAGRGGDIDLYIELMMWCRSGWRRHHASRLNW